MVLRVIGSVTVVLLALAVVTSYGRGAKDQDPLQWPLAAIGALIVLAAIWVP